jgi:PsbP-like protein
MAVSTRSVYVSYSITFGILAILLIPLGESTLPNPLVPKNVFARISNSTANTTSSTNTANFLTYKDSSGRFSIDYPSGWKVNQAKNRFEPFAVEFISPDLLSRLTIRFIKINNIGDDIETVMSGT